MQLSSVNQLSHTPLSSLSLSTVVGDAVITCREARRDGLQLRLMNSHWHVQQSTSIMLITLQELCKNCSCARIAVQVLQVSRYFIVFWCKVAKLHKLLHNSCARVLFYFILLQMSEPL